MLEEILLTVGSEITREQAKAAARKKLPPDAMLLAWYDRRERTGSPEARPGRSAPTQEAEIEDYARSRGAKAKVVVNDRFALFFIPTPRRPVDRER